MSASSRPISEADLHAFVDGQMEFERRALIVQAMAAEPDIKAKVELWRRQNEALTATFGGVLREPLPLRLMPTTLARDVPPRLVKAIETRPVPPANLRAAPTATAKVAAIAVMAFLAGGALALLGDAVNVNAGLAGTANKELESAFPYGGRALAIRAFEAHRTYVTDLNHPVEVPASDEGRLLDWIQHRLSMTIRIPDLRQQGWTLIGGRVLPGEIGPAAFLIYGNGVERLGLYMARTNIHQGAEFSVYDNGAGLGSVGYWIEEPVGYAITTNRDGGWLDRNGLELHRVISAQTRDNDWSE